MPRVTRDEPKQLPDFLKAAANHFRIQHEVVFEEWRRLDYPAPDGCVGTVLGDLLNVYTWIACKTEPRMP